MEFKIDPLSAKRFIDDVEELFDKIEKNVTDQKDYDRTVERIKKTMKEGALPDMVNRLEYSKVKSKLKADGKIENDVPLAVTGTLINSLRFQLLEKHPNEILNSINFASVDYATPTLVSMYKAAKGYGNLEYEEANTVATINKLAASGKFPVAESIYKLYARTLANQTLRKIDKAFKDMKNASKSSN